MKKSLFENIQNNLNESKKDYSEIIDFFIDNIEDIESNGGHLESFIQTLINNDCLNIENIKDLIDRYSDDGEYGDEYDG